MIPILSKILSITPILSVFGITKKEFWKTVIISSSVVFLIGSAFVETVQSTIHEEKKTIIQRMNERDSLIENQIIQNQKEVLRRLDKIDSDIDRANDNILEIYKSKPR